MFVNDTCITTENHEVKYLEHVMTSEIMKLPVLNLRISRGIFTKYWCLGPI